MKKVILILLAMLVVMALAGCDSEEQPLQTTEAPVATTEAPAETSTEASAETPAETTAPKTVEGFTFTANGIALIPGAAFDPAVLPEAASVYTVPSCALEGTDNVYNYETFEVTAFNDGTGEIIYAIALIDPNITTDEGLMLGDDRAKVIELYGEDYQENGTALVYSKGDSILTVIMQNDYVVDIELRMAD